MNVKMGLRTQPNSPVVTRSVALGGVDPDATAGAHVELGGHTA
jgi:hypothetical protein